VYHYTRVLRAGHKLAVVAHRRQKPPSTDGVAKDAADVMAEELRDAILSRAAVAAVGSRDMDTEMDTEAEAEAEDEELEESKTKDAKKRVFVQLVDITDAKQAIPDAIAAAVRRFYSIDAVVNLLRPTTVAQEDGFYRSSAAAAIGSLEATSGADFDELFDVLVRASFVVTREALPHLARSEGPRRIVALCPPPLALRDHFRPAAAAGPALALARACQGLHLVGQAAEFAELDPPIAVNSLWASSSSEDADADEDEDERLARAVELMLVTPPPTTVAAAASATPGAVQAKDDKPEAEAKLGEAEVKAEDAQLASGTFWRVEDVVGGVATSEKKKQNRDDDDDDDNDNDNGNDNDADAAADAVLHPMTTCRGGLRDVRLPGYTTRDVVFPDVAEELLGLLGGGGGREATLGWGL
jgi:NAD(P)-dependent dehydrogenase (short-subunit alcohol dehydrogenase family)